MSEAATEHAAGQRWDAAGYNRDAGFVAALGAPLLELLAPVSGMRVLDLGCGEGALTEKLVEAGLAVVAVDASPEMIEAARARGLDARLGDGHALRFEAAFDAVFSNAALHWMTRPEEVVQGVARALVPGGVFVGEFGGFGNVAAICTAMRAVLSRRGIDAGGARPWYFPTPEAYSSLLEAHGFTVERAWLIPRPTPLPTGMAGWLRTFAAPFLEEVPVVLHRAVIDEAVALLGPSLEDERGNWIADYVRLRFRARLDGGTRQPG